MGRIEVNTTLTYFLVNKTYKANMLLSHLNGSCLLFPKLRLREAAPSFCKLSPQPNVPDSLLSLSDKREHKEEEDDFTERSPEANGEEEVQEQNDSERDKVSDTCEEIKTLSIWEKIKRDAVRKTCRVFRIKSALDTFSEIFQC